MEQNKPNREIIKLFIFVYGHQYSICLKSSQFVTTRKVYNSLTLFSSMRMHNTRYSRSYSLKMILSKHIISAIERISKSDTKHSIICILQMPFTQNQRQKLQCTNTEHFNSQTNYNFEKKQVKSEKQHNIFTVIAIVLFECGIITHHAI